MPRKNVLVKLSSDVYRLDSVHNWIERQSQTYFVVALIGGGTQINEALVAADKSVGNFGPLGRELVGLPERQIARDQLELNEAEFQDLLAERGIHIGAVIKPAMDIGGVLCHQNGDIYVLNAYLSYDIIYVLTLDKRKKEKEAYYERLGNALGGRLKKIHVIGVPSNFKD
jgi:hypothetical protein